MSQVACFLRQVVASFVKQLIRKVEQPGEIEHSTRQNTLG